MNLEPATALREGRQILARVTWLVTLSLYIAVFILRLPFVYRDSFLICTDPACLNSGRMTSEKWHALQQLGIPVHVYVVIGFVLLIGMELGYMLIGVILFRRAWGKPNEKMVLIASFALVSFGGTFSSFDPVTPYPAVLNALILSLTFLGNAGIGLFFYLFPTGDFARSWIRWLAAGWIVYWGINNLVFHSLVVPDGAWGFLFAGFLASVVTVQVYRYRKLSTPLERRQAKWVVYGITMALAGFVASAFLTKIYPLGLVLGDGFMDVFLLLVPISIASAITRAHLWDIDLLINRTILYVTLTASVITLYVLVVVSLGALLQTSGNLLISLIGTGLIAILFHPLRMRLERIVNRMMFGERDTPYRVISQLGQRLEATLASETLFSTIVETVAHALKLPYAAITLNQDGAFVTSATYGQPTDEPTRLPLFYQQERIGELLLAPRAPGESFTRADRALLDDLARQAGMVAHAVRLSADLHRMTQELHASRTQLVTMREEERRRLRRDLHDGLGSVLTSITFQLDAAGNLLEREPQTVRTMLQDIKTQTQASIADIRRLVYNLRPPILDDWGLIAALREQITQYQFNQLQMTLDAPESLPELPAAIELAAYRIALESIANVIRHAHATSCTLHLSIYENKLIVEVRDDGTGLPENHRAGVGILAMRERADELGGSCEVESNSNGGTRVYACLPLPKE